VSGNKDTEGRVGLRVSCILSFEGMSLSLSLSLSLSSRSIGQDVHEHVRQLELQCRENIIVVCEHVNHAFALK
jgi:hypothetical protein